MPREHALSEERPVVILVHDQNLQVSGVLEGHSTQVQGKGLELQRGKTGADKVSGEVQGI